MGEATFFGHALFVVSQIVKIIKTRLWNVVQFSITTLKCSEDSHCGVRIKVSKPSDLPFSSYWPRPFFGPAILAEKWKNLHYIEFAQIGCRFLTLLLPEIDCNYLFKVMTKGNAILEEKSIDRGFSGIAITKIAITKIWWNIAKILMNLKLQRGKLISSPMCCPRGLVTPKKSSLPNSLGGGPKSGHALFWLPCPTWKFENGLFMLI